MTEHAADCDCARACKLLEPLASSMREVLVRELEQEAARLRWLEGRALVRGIELPFVPGHPMFAVARATARALMSIADGFEIESVVFRPTEEQACAWFVNVHGRGAGVCGHEKRVHAGELADAWESSRADEAKYAIARRLAERPPYKSEHMTYRSLVDIVGDVLAEAKRETEGA